MWPWTSPLLNASKICPIFCGAIPGPSSDTHSTRRPLAKSSPQPTRTVPAAAVLHGVAHEVLQHDREQFPVRHDHRAGPHSTASCRPLRLGLPRELPDDLRCHRVQIHRRERRPRRRTSAAVRGPASGACPPTVSLMALLGESERFLGLGEPARRLQILPEQSSESVTLSRLLFRSWERNERNFNSVSAAARSCRLLLVDQGDHRPLEHHVDGRVQGGGLQHAPSAGPARPRRAGR